MPFNTVDTTGFDNAIAALNRALDAYKEARSVLQNRATSLDSDWEGRGGDKYRRVSRMMFRALDDDGESLSYIAENLAIIRKAYQDADQKVARKIEATETD